METVKLNDMADVWIQEVYQLFKPVLPISVFVIAIHDGFSHRKTVVWA
jgi:hypothetical protein